jgi:hypothetical protein
MLFPGHDYARGSICDRQGDFSGLNKNLLSDNQEEGITFHVSYLIGQHVRGVVR